MRDHGAIVQPAVDLARLVHEWDAIDGHEQRSMAEFRAAKAKILIQARGGFNDRGDGFKDFVEKKLKTPFVTAWRWMKDAGYVAPKEPGSGAKPKNHFQNENESNSEQESDLKPVSEEPRKQGNDSGTDPENYRTAFLLRANAAVEYATMTPPLLAQYYQLKPRRKEKHHQEFIAMARKAAKAWSDLANKLEEDNE